jgi:hypothetical protein
VKQHTRRSTVEAVSGTSADRHACTEIAKKTQCEQKESTARAERVHRSLLPTIPPMAIGLLLLRVCVAMVMSSIEALCTVGNIQRLMEGVERRHLRYGGSDNGGERRAQILSAISKVRTLFVLMMETKQEPAHVGRLAPSVTRMVTEEQRN